MLCHEADNDLPEAPMSREDVVTHTPPIAERILERNFATMLNEVSREANQHGFEAMRRIAASGVLGSSSSN